MTVLNRTIKATANDKKRTFTLRVYVNGKLSAKYRTNVMDKEEFQSSQHHTQNDWNQFLKSDSYYIIKSY